MRIIKMYTQIISKQIVNKLLYQKIHPRIKVVISHNRNMNNENIFIIAVFRFFMLESLFLYTHTHRKTKAT